MIVWSLFSHQSLKKSTALGLYECQPAKLKTIQHMEHTNIDFDYCEMHVDSLTPLCFETFF